MSNEQIKAPCITVKKSADKEGNPSYNFWTWEKLYTSWSFKKKMDHLKMTIAQDRTKNRITEEFLNRTFPPKS